MKDIFRRWPADRIGGSFIIITDRNFNGMGVARSFRGSISQTKRNVQTSMVLEILRTHRNGLTSLQIAVLMGEGLRKDVLWRLQKEGKIRQKRGLLDDGKIRFLYVLNRSKGDQPESQGDPGF